jgi:hypothetical protein
MLLFAAVVVYLSVPCSVNVLPDVSAPKASSAVPVSMRSATLLALPPVSVRA